MVEFIEHSVKRGNYRLYAREYDGGEPPIVLMHGFPDNLHLYDLVVPFLSPRRVIVFDFLGWGSSDKPSGYAYTAANQEADLDAVINQFELANAVLVAHDASGPPAIDWARHHPNRVAALVFAQYLLRRDADAPTTGSDLPLLDTSHQECGPACVRGCSII